MKSFIKYVLFSVFICCLLTGCVDNEPDYEVFPSDGIAFQYKVEGDYALDYLVGSVIKFSNTSEWAGTPVWDFGDGSQTVTGDEVTHLYQVAGTYNVSLTIEGKGKLTQKLMISDIFPTVSVDPIEGGICEVGITSVHFSVILPNPQNLPVEYTWIFPDGTKNSDGQPITSSALTDPGDVTFSNIGSQKVTLKTKLGGRSLQDGVLNVQVGYTQNVKTIYYAEKGGNIMALKLISNLPVGTKNYPFNLGVKSGQHPLNIIFSDSSLYVIDAGRQFYYINDADGNLGDGRIFRLAKDGSLQETMLTNKKAAFDDPFYGYAEGDYLYFSDRNTGIMKILKTERNLAMDKTDPKLSYFVQNATLQYYGAGWGYGAINACFTKLKDGTWWWAKTYNNQSIFRFQNKDILPNAISQGDINKIPFPRLSDDLFIKSFVVDEDRRMVYYAVRDKGFCKATIEQFTETGAGKINSSNIGTLVLEMISDNEGASNEYIDICQMVLDPEDGCVYFGYRKGEGSTIVSGLKRYNPATDKVESVIDNVNIYGVSINHTKSKLF